MHAAVCTMLATCLLLLQCTLQLVGACPLQMEMGWGVSMGSHADEIRRKFVGRAPGWPNSTAAQNASLYFMIHKSTELGNGVSVGTSRASIPYLVAHTS